MIKVSNIETFGWMAAIRGMRNSWNSWERSDSEIIGTMISIGPNDLKLMHTLYDEGPSHRKYLRMIHVQMDILAPLYWWKEFDTYKVGTVSNSTSTMHKIADHEFTLDDFSIEHLANDDWVEDSEHHKWTGALTTFETYLHTINTYRELYLKESDSERKKNLWWQMIQMLPSSYNQLRTIDMNYENVFTIIRQRYGHKLDEWRDFCKILKTLGLCGRNWEDKNDN